MLKYLDIESVKIACWISENDLDENRQSLLFIHGSGGDHTAWSHQYSRLHKKYKTAAIDLPGHGNSTGNGESNVSLYCEWVKKVIDALGFKRPVLVGHSLGAAIALEFAISRSGEIAGIVCIGGGMKMPVNPFFLDFLKTNPPQIPPEVVELICKYSVAKENRSIFLEPLQKSISQGRVDALYGDLFACNELDLNGKTDKIEVPALIVCGAEDKMTSPDLSRQLAAGIKEAGLEIVTGAGHMVMMERPEAFNILLDNFVASASE